MTDKIKITPRARRLAQKHGIDLAALDIKGTGFQGGISEKDLLAWIDKSDLNNAPAAAPQANMAATTAPIDGSLQITPLAKKMAMTEGIDPAVIAGSGPHGKVVKADIISADKTALAKGSASSRAEVIGVSPEGKRISKKTPYAGVRKIIGDRLAQSKFTAPHLYFTQKVDLSALMELRALVNSKQEKKTSVTDYISRAVVMTLQAYPEMNSSLAGDEIQEFASVNLGIAVASPTGLIVPVIKEAQDMSVVELSKTVAPLIDKARNGKLKPDEYTGGTFTISNLGMFGIENFTAIINPPEVGILAVSATKDEAVVIAASDGTKKIEIRPMMNITLSVDHRLIDGLLAAQFVTEIKRLLETPLELMIQNWE